MSDPNSNRKWHQQKRWIMGSLLLFPPLGIPLLWKTGWSRFGKVSGSILSGFILMLALLGESSESTVVEVEPPDSEVVESDADETQTSVDLVVETPAYDNAIAEAVAANEAIAIAESSADWAQIALQWEAAISYLREVPASSPNYSQAQTKIAEYLGNYEEAVAQKTAIDAVAAEAIAQQQAADQQAADQRAAEQREIEQREAEQIEAAIAEESYLSLSGAESEETDSYVSGTCKELRASGIGSNFRPGDANYTSARDRDNDGIACES